MIFDCEWERAEGKPIDVAGRRITPVSRGLRDGWPGGGMVWNRPCAVWVQGREGRARIPSADITRGVQALCYGLSLLAVGIGWRGARRGRFAEPSLGSNKEQDT